jgi:hypothetical protein
MRITVRPADLHADRDILIDMMLRFLTPMSDGARYDWLYHQNPDGQAQLWILINSDTGAIVGSGGIVPRRMFANGQESLCAILVDFWIHPEYRSLGPALQLQRACLAGIEAGPYDLYYDFPKQNMVAVYRRLGIETSQWLVRLTKPLSLKRKLGRLGQIPLLGRSLIAATNGILKLRDAGRGNRSGCTISEQRVECGDDFTQLAFQVSSKYGACVARTAKYLNWRFLSHFHHRYEMLTARRDGSLLGYILFLQDAETATILDLFGMEDENMKSDLVFTALEVLRKRNVLSVNAPSLRAHSQTAFLRKLGFYSREPHPVVISAPRGKADLDGANFFLMDGDRDS